MRVPTLDWSHALTGDADALPTRSRSEGPGAIDWSKAPIRGCGGDCGCSSGAGCGCGGGEMPQVDADQRQKRGIKEAFHKVADWLSDRSWGSDYGLNSIPDEPREPVPGETSTPGEAKKKYKSPGEATKKEDCECEAPFGCSPGVTAKSGGVVNPGDGGIGVPEVDDGRLAEGVDAWLSPPSWMSGAEGGVPRLNLSGSGYNVYYRAGQNPWTPPIVLTEKTRGDNPNLRVDAKWVGGWLGFIPYLVWLSAKGETTDSKGDSGGKKTVTGRVAFGVIACALPLFRRAKGVSSSSVLSDATWEIDCPEDERLDAAFLSLSEYLYHQVSTGGNFASASGGVCSQACRTSILASYFAFPSYNGDLRQMFDPTLEDDLVLRPWISYQTDDYDFDADKNFDERIDLTTRDDVWPQWVYGLVYPNTPLNVNAGVLRPWLFQRYSSDGACRFPQMFSRFGAMRIIDVKVKRVPQSQRPVDVLRRALAAILGDKICFETWLGFFHSSTYLALDTDSAGQDIEGLRRQVKCASRLEFSAMESLAALTERVYAAGSGDGVQFEPKMRHALSDLAFLAANTEFAAPLVCLHEDLQPASSAPSSWHITAEQDWDTVYHPSPVPQSYVGDPVTPGLLELSWSEVK